jgi:16S rRNA (adenine1518-N6/adenine1519-N6)-dimethyltransferase
MIPKKSLGQNFLVNDDIARKIAEATDIENKNVLEIGPGKGILTKHLTRKAGRVLAIEIDENVAKICEDILRRSDLEEGAEIIGDDILKIDLPALLEKNTFLPYKVVANLPYYITSKIIRLFLETKYPPDEMILMVQKEVGERIVAQDAKPRSETRSVSTAGGKESILSISVKFYAEPKILFPVSRENFDPAPEVDSVVIRIKRKNTPDADPKKFFSLVRAGFSSKRKTLENNLSAGFQVPKAEITEILEKTGLEPAVRAEKLSLEDWVRLYSVFSTMAEASL